MMNPKQSFCGLAVLCGSLLGHFFGGVKALETAPTIIAPTQVEDVFSPGPFAVTSFSLPGANACSQLGPDPCKPTTIYAPQLAGDYPVVQFQHGYVLETAFYTQLLSRVASFGFVVVAPQMYRVPPFGLPLETADATQEISDAVAMLRWTQTSLNDALASNVGNVTGNAHHATVAGHSRGGKVAAGVALNVSGSCGSEVDAADGVCRQPPLQAVVLLDPVDGTASPGCCPNGCPTAPQLTQQQLAFNAPLLLVGTALGQVPKYQLPVFDCPCAPAKFGFEAFFNQTSGETYSFLAEQYGHLDMLNDRIGQLNAALIACVAGTQRQPMRDFAAGMLVAFLRDKVTHELDFQVFVDQLSANPDLAPILFLANQHA